ncbi:MAG: DUF5602 domain-containing protein [Ferruginibacter sp.]
MKKLLRFQLAIMLGAALISLPSCKKEMEDDNDDTMSITEKIIMPAQALTVASPGNSSSQDYNTFYGPQTQMGNGHARSWINISRENNQPLAIGIEFSQGAMNNLPTNPLDFAASTFVLTLHQKAKEVTPFDHITLNWEPNGHEPNGIYDVPHFDMHFYKISVTDQMAITGAPTAPPAAGYLPVQYVIQGATVPQMGTHWLNPASPELPPTLAPFTHTMIYGTNTARVIFIEPMITRAFLLAGTQVNMAIPQPVHFEPANTYYPQQYSIWKNADNGRNYVALNNFAWR